MMSALFAAMEANSAQQYQTGFRTMGLWSQETRMRLDLNIWYPCKRPENELNYAPWIIKAALNAKPMEGKFPLLVISHASPGTRFSYHYLASFFAREGYVVMAPTHSTDYMENMDDLFTWRQLEKRINEINTCLDVILADKNLSPIIDANHIGFIGFGTGGTAGLLLGGSMPNCGSWPAYCSHAGIKDPYCTPWTKEKINLLCKNFPLKQSMLDKRFKALVIFAPAYGMIFNNASFNNFNTPILLACAGKDSFNQAELHCEPLARILGKKAIYLDLISADAGALMDSCPPALAADLPELCNSISSEDRASLHAKITNTVSAFFKRYLFHENLSGKSNIPDSDKNKNE